MHVLIVDDDPLAGELVAAVLDEAGHACRVAGSAAEALAELAADGRFGLVISDQQMPQLSGLDLYRAVRAGGHALPFILLTGDDPAPLAVQAPGLAGVLRKDAELEESLPALLATLAASGA